MQQIFFCCIPDKVCARGAFNQDRNSKKTTLMTIVALKGCEAFVVHVCYQALVSLLCGHAIKIAQIKQTDKAEGHNPYLA